MTSRERGKCFDTVKDFAEYQFFLRKGALYFLHELATQREKPNKNISTTLVSQ